MNRREKIERDCRGGGFCWGDQRLQDKLTTLIERIVDELAMAPARRTHANATECSKAAGRLPVKGKRHKVMLTLMANPERGCTGPELAKLAGMQRLTACALLTTMTQAGLCHETDMKRPNPETGKDCTVYKWGMA